jgi:flagellin-like protein
MDIRGVSPIVGMTLMVVIVVLLAATMGSMAMGSMAMGFGEKLTEPGHK